MDKLGLAHDGALANGAEEIGLHLDGGEIGGRLGLGDEATIAASAVGQRDDAGGVQEAVGREVVVLHVEPAADVARAGFRPSEPQMVWELPALTFGKGGSE